MGPGGGGGVRGVKDNAFTKRGFRRRCNNYFMGPGGGAHPPRGAALKTMLLRNEVSDGDAIITLWGRGRRTRAAVRRVKDNAFTKRGFRRRCNNYFMGAAGGAHAPRCAAAR